MARLSLKILQNRRNAAGKIVIYVSLTFKQDVRYISTGFEINDESEFENGLVCYRKDASTMNKRLSFILNEYREKLKRIDETKFRTCTQLKEALINSEETESLSVKTLFDRRISELEKQGRKSYANMNRYTSNVILSILSDIPIDYLTRRDIRKIDREFKMRGYAPGNIQMRFRDFKAALNEAIEEGFVKYEDHPFKGYKMPQSGSSRMDINNFLNDSISNYLHPLWERPKNDNDDGRNSRAFWNEPDL